MTMLAGWAKTKGESLGSGDGKGNGELVTVGALMLSRSREYDSDSAVCTQFYKLCIVMK